MPNAVKEVLGTNNPSKRIADPSEIAKLAVCLASDDSAYVVGADFLIDGVLTAVPDIMTSPLKNPRRSRTAMGHPAHPGSFRTVSEPYLRKALDRRRLGAKERTRLLMRDIRDRIFACNELHRRLMLG